MVAGLSAPAWRRARTGATALGAAAAGILWGAGGAAAYRADCRTRWPDGERLVLVAEPVERPAGSRMQLVRVRGGACHGAVVRTFAARQDADVGTRVLVGRWRRDPLARPERPQRAERLGTLVVRHQRAMPWPTSWRSRARL